MRGQKSEVGDTRTAPKPWTEIDWAYLAGRIDADGSIGCYGQKPNGWINVRVDLYSNDLEYLKTVQRDLGGWISKNSTTWQWCAGQPAERILMPLLPYLRTKLAQAEHAIKCRTHINKTPEERQYYLDRSKELNGRFRSG